MTIKRSVSTDTAGFTILELMVATAVFAMIMLVITAGIIGFTRQYYKGVITSNTQSTTRTLISEITQAIQFGGSITTDLSNGATKAFCVDNKVYTYVLGQQVSDSSPNAAADQAYHALVVDNSKGACDAATVPSPLPTTAALADPQAQRELIGDRMRLAVLDIKSDDGITFTIRTRIIYGDNDVLQPNVSAPGFDWAANGATVKCLPNLASSQFCAITDLTTTVQKRIQ